MMKFFMILVLLYYLTGCLAPRVSKDGAVSTQVAVDIKQFGGDYSVAGSALQFRLAVDGLRPTLRTNQDILGRNCGARIGRLLDVTLGVGWDFVAAFAFDPGNCPDLVGTLYSAPIHLNIYVKQDGKHAMFILRKGPVEGDSKIPGSNPYEYRGTLKRISDPSK